MCRSRSLLLLALAAGLAGCGRKDGETGASTADGITTFNDGFAPYDCRPEMEAHYATFKFVPPELTEALATNKITQAEHDEQHAALPAFFQFKTPEDIPANLTWDDGMDLPEFANPDAPKGGTFYYNVADFPRTLRHVGPDANGSFRTYLLDDVEMLFARRHPNITESGPNGFRYFPGLATSWAVDRAAKTVYVRLNPEARYSDGVPVKADDVFFSFYMHQSPHIKAPWYNIHYTTNYKSIAKYDDHTFSMTLVDLRPDFLDRVLTLYPMPAHFFRELGPDYPERYQWRVQPTTGAYTILEKDIDKGRSITLTRVKDWWGQDQKFWRGRYNMDRIRFTVVREAAKAFDMFKKGEMDFIRLNLTELWYDKLPDTDPDVQKGYIHKATFYNDIPRPNYGLWINRHMPLLDNRDIREGINFATNWELVCEKYARGDWTRMNTGADGYGDFTHPTLQARPFDIGAARAAFAKAGFTRAGTDGILVNDAGQRLSFTLTTGIESFKDVLVILREEALKCGLDFRIEVLEQTAAFKKAQEKKHDITLTAFNVSPELFPRYLDFCHSKNAYDNAFLPDGSVNPARTVKVQTNNLCQMAIFEMDKLIDVYERSEDIEEMKKLAHQMEEIRHHDASFVPGFVIPHYRAGHWRWLKFPDGYNVKISTDWWEFHLFWSDEEEREETIRARRSGKPFPPGIEVHDQFAPKS